MLIICLRTPHSTRVFNQDSITKSSKECISGTRFMSPFNGAFIDIYGDCVLLLSSHYWWIHLASVGCLMDYVNVVSGLSPKALNYTIIIFVFTLRLRSLCYSNQMWSVAFSTSWFKSPENRCRSSFWNFSFDPFEFPVSFLDSNLFDLNKFRSTHFSDCDIIHCSLQCWSVISWSSVRKVVQLR